MTACGGPRRILVVRLGSMGDVIHTLPAVATLRAEFPGAHIGWVIEERWSELLCAAKFSRIGQRTPARPLVDAVHVVNTHAWRHAMLSDETWQEVRAVRRELRDFRYDLAVDFQGAWKSAIVGAMSGAETLAGSRQPRESPASLFYTRKIEPLGAHIVEQNLSLVRSLAGNHRAVYSFELPRDQAAEEQVDRELRRLGMGDFAMINPGAGWGAKCWPAERYAAVAHGLAGVGLPTIVNYGPGEESLARQVEDQANGAARALPCSLGELIALTRRASLFVGGDTGPTHLAAALDVPVIAIFGPTDPARNGPFGSGPREVLRSAGSLTSHARRAEPEAGLLTITADQVVAAAHRVMQVRA